ncbi:unnamed protein product [Trifolium pratense]|uniref:Uncharacterized protein n=1 Tax=Trifolium pratense TaxID=57577 RepID=A0ACB0JVE7_TRIPR|nr:unnamed protein product [Trifolium pratense]
MQSRINMTKFSKLVYAMILLLFIFLVVTNAMNVNGVFLLKSLCAICMGVTVGRRNKQLENLEEK